MTSIEERLARDIAAVTTGVVVTDSELLEARKSLEERIDVRRRRNRFRVAAAVTAAAAAVAVGGVVAMQTVGDDDGGAEPVTTPTAPAVSREDADWLIGAAPTTAVLNGVWRVDDGTSLLRFTADGHVSVSAVGKLFGNPSVTGTYTVDGYEIAITTDASAAECANQEMVLRASVFGTGNVRYALATSTDCAPLPVGRQDLDQALPTSEGMKFENTGGWGPLAAGTDLRGDFIAEGGGYILELDRDGTYYVANNSGGAVDRGRWTRQDRQLTLTSSAGSTACQRDDVLVLSALEATTEPGTLVFRGTVQQNTCDAGWVPTGWVLIPSTVG
jgi:hypothetical protein